MKKLLSSLAFLVAVPALSACSAVDDALDQCGIECKGIVEAQGSVSGVTSIDAFFRSVANFRAQADVLEADVQAILGEMAAGMGLEVAAGASVDDLSAAISAELKGGFGGKIDGGIALQYEPPKCAVNAQASVEAAAKCDATVDKGKASVECKGECVADVNAMVECEGELKCTGTAPAFACEGTCEGSCELEVGAKCEGTCEGTCEVAAEADCDGEFKADAEGAGGGGKCNLNAGAKCEGECKGSCELNGGLECQGECKGECTYTAPQAECQGKASCSAMAGGSVECKGECKGEFEPPEVKAECKASAKAEASFSAECTPPTVGLDYKLAASLQGEANVDARLELEGKIQAFAKAYGKLLAKVEKLKLVASAGAKLGADATGAVDGAIKALGKGDISLDLVAGLSCAAGSVDDAAGLVGEGASSLNATGSAAGNITTALSGS